MYCKDEESKQLFYQFYIGDLPISMQFYKSKINQCTKMYYLTSRQNLWQTGYCEKILIPAIKLNTSKFE